jgi:hypothetical protein
VTDARNAIEAFDGATLVAVTVILKVAVCVGFLKGRAYGQGRVIEWPLGRICYPFSRSESLTYATMIRQMVIAQHTTLITDVLSPEQLVQKVMVSQLIHGLAGTCVMKTSNGTPGWSSVLGHVSKYKGRKRFRNRPLFLS